MWKFRQKVPVFGTFLFLGYRIQGSIPYIKINTAWIGILSVVLRSTYTNYRASCTQNVNVLLHLQHGHHRLSYLDIIDTIKKCDINKLYWDTRALMKSKCLFVFVCSALTFWSLIIQCSFQRIKFFISIARCQ